MDSSSVPPSDPPPTATPPAAVALPVIEPPPVAPPKPVPVRFAFHGDAAEYFRIWIVNTFLTLVTLGVYSAWAKVRKRRYLRGNTELLGHRFDYTADPKRILIGNVIVVTLFLLYALFGAVYPMLRGLAVIVGVALLPWIVVRSHAFNAHHTMWRGLRFHFHPSLSAAVMVYLLKPLVIPFTLGIYYPAWSRSRTEFHVTRHRLGTARFHFETKVGPFYAAHVASGAILFLGFLVLAISVGVYVQLNHGHPPTPDRLVPVLLLWGLLLFFVKHLVFALLFNPIWNGTRLDEHRFRANLQAGRWLGLQFGNLAAIIVSCGLLYPWAVVRSARYVAGCLALQPAGPLDDISRLGASRGSAVGDTVAEFAGLDFGL